MDFSNRIIEWYGKNKRDLPWRHTNDPYRIWVSEVIMQQTRVEQGLPYYNRFIERFPDISSLAEAGEDEVMKMWQGLGYYTRARNMHRSARDILQESRARFPASYDEIKKMHGIGDYSASAIASIAYGEPCPVVDGNVLRVISRYSGIMDDVSTSVARKKVKDFLIKVIDPGQPGTFNQAVMELGALVCKPKQPLCAECPLRENCFAFIHNQADQLPVVKKAKAPVTRYFHYIVLVNRVGNDNFTWLRKRSGDDIWRNLYDFPLVEDKKELSSADLFTNPHFNEIFGPWEFTFQGVTETFRHILSHQELRAKFFFLAVHDPDIPGLLKINEIDIKKYAVPRLIENFLKKVAFRPGIFSDFPDKQ